MQDRPNREHCQALARAGWKWETRDTWQLGHNGKWYASNEHMPSMVSIEDEIPRPSIGELRERLNDEDIINYIRHYLKGSFMWEFCAYDILKVTADTSSLCDIWTRKDKA